MSPIWNLDNNAYESLGDCGNVRLTLYSSSKQASIIAKNFCPQRAQDQHTRWLNKFVHYQSIRFFLTLTSLPRLRRHTKNKKFFLMPNLVVRCTALTLPLDLTCILGKKIATKEKRWYKNVGLGFKTPLEAINGTYIGA